MSPKRIIKNSIAAIIIGFLLYLAGPRELLQTLSQLTAATFAYLMLISFLLIHVSVLKWQLFLQHFSERVSSFRLFNLYLTGYFVNLILPSYLGGDAVRSFYIGKRVGQHEAAAATILERYTGIVAMLLFAFVFMWQVEAVTWQIKGAVVACLAALFTGTIFVLSRGMLQLAGRITVLKPAVPHLDKVRDALHLARKDRGLLIKAMSLSFLFHTITVLNTAAAAFAVGWFDPPIWDLFVVLPLILLIGALPVSPNGLGMQEGAFYFFLHSIGATPAQALGVAVVLRAKSYVLALIGWLSWLWIKRDDPKRMAEFEKKAAKEAL
ncbi:MAG: flippase-like domain-containing protein [Deltaproteobacteria bacterium]|nr:flippase-like domain-containing protein [Deltaproteobacteria bacterium]